MNYLRRYRRSRGPRGALGDVSSTLATAADVAADPYLSEFICRLRQLKAVHRNEPMQPCADTPAGSYSDFGMSKVMPLVRGYVYAEQNPWAYAVAALVVLGVPLWIGYELGRGG